MATLFDKQIDLTYQGLIKTEDNGALGTVEKEITDGTGVSSTLKLGTTSASFVGTLDLTGATVTGLPPSGVSSVVAGTNVTVDNTDPANPIVSATGGDGDTTYELSTVQFGSAAIIELQGSDLSNSTIPLFAGTNITLTSNGTNITIDAAGGAAGLVPGTVADSIKSADSLTTIASTATATNAIAIGNGADATQAKNIVLGTGNAGSTTMIVIGDATAPQYANNTIAIGNNYPTDLAFRGESVSVGHGIYPSGSGVYIGNGANHTLGGATNCVAIGKSAKTSANQSISLGANSWTTAADSVAIGYGVTGDKVATVSMKALDLQTASTTTAGGIIMTDAGSIERRLNINASGELQIDSTLVGAPTVFTLPAFTQTGLADSDYCYAVTLIPGGTFGNGDVLELRSLEQRDGLTATAYESYNFSTQSQTAGSPVNFTGTTFQQAGAQLPNNGPLYWQKTLYINASGTGVSNYSYPNETYQQFTMSGDPAAYQAVDWTVDQYFFYQLWQDSTTGSITNFGTVLRKIN